MDRKALPKWAQPLTEKEIRHAKKWLCDGSLSKKKVEREIAVNKNYAMKNNTTLTQLCWVCSSIAQKLGR